jgi:hypothetical protein
MLLVKIEGDDVGRRWVGRGVVGALEEKVIHEDPPMRSKTMKAFDEHYLYQRTAHQRTVPLPLHPHHPTLYNTSLAPPS